MNWRDPSAHRARVVRIRPPLWIALLCACLWAAPAEPSQHLVHAGVYVNEPFVTEEEGMFTGMAVDLWREVGEALGVETEYTRYPTLDALIMAVEAGSADVILSNLSVTHERARRVRFTYPWFDSGLRIMVDGDSTATSWGELRQSGKLRTYALLFCALLLATFLTTTVRRRMDPDFPQRWIEGLALCFNDLVIAFKAGKVRERCLGWFGWLGQILSGLWALCGVGVIAYVTSSAASAMTVTTLTGGIGKLGDLPGKVVGVFRGSVSEEYLRGLGVATISYDGIEEAASALGAGEVRAVVASAPVLEYWVIRYPNENACVVGAPFHPDKFAFATSRRQDDFTDRISAELIRLQESGRLEELRRKYFGSGR